MATVHRDDHGNLVLNDPDGLSVVKAVGKHNCKLTLSANADRVSHFVTRVTERGESPQNVVIVVANVDDPHGEMLASLLMPGQDWQQYRDRGEVPFARGLAGREGIRGFLAEIDKEAADKLRDSDGLAVVVVDYGVAEIFDPSEQP